MLLRTPATQTPGTGFGLARAILTADRCAHSAGGNNQMICSQVLRRGKRDGVREIKHGRKLKWYSKSRQ